MSIECEKSVFVVATIDNGNIEFFGVFDDESDACNCAADYDALVHVVDYWPIEEFKRLES